MIKVFLFTLFVVAVSVPAQANTIPFDVWLGGVRQEAMQRGVSGATLDTALAGTELQYDVLRLDRKQPEGRITFEEYKKRNVTNTMIEQGRALYREHFALLQGIAQQYGVAAKYIVALWGVETRYGTYTGGFNVIDSLATLAYDGRRSGYFRGELMNALSILERGEIGAYEMEGSWAGAMGQCQFMPTTFLHYAVDYNRDGRRDIWSTLPDVFASMANYLRAEGWRDGITWGRAVRLTKPVAARHAGLDYAQSLRAWHGAGVRQSNGQPLPLEDIKASLVQPDGAGGASYLVYDNYRALMRWNRSTYFATTVGLLADEIAS
ncbi:MAG: lytic murein transglycosylase [Alphaproteobacteria bacterium]|nr:lytic murein transglycosylase [Alphaproteobacteria bacterium]